MKYKILISLLVIVLFISLVSADVSYRYVKWEVVEKKGVEASCVGQSCIQSAEFVLLLDNSTVSWPGGTTATNPGGANPGGEGPGNMVDGNIATKWLDYNFNPTAGQTTGNANLSIDVGTGNTVLFNGYKWGTANDVPARDPISWVLYGSDDSSTWVELDTKNSQTITDSRNVYTTNYQFQSSDTIYPTFSNYWDNNASLSNSGVALFNVTIENTNGTVLLEINNTNITATNLSGNIYNVSYEFITNGTYIYKWHSWGNGSNSNYNVSETRDYTVNSNPLDIIPPQINFTLPTPPNGTTTNTSIEINVSITEANLNELVYNWNQTNFTVYDNSLILMMNFNNVSDLGENNTHVVDLSGKGNHGRVNANWESIGKYGGAFEFDGINQNVSIPNSASINITSTITVSAWIKANKWRASTYQGSIICNDYWSGAVNGGYCLRAGNNGALDFVLSNNSNGGWLNAQTASIMSSETWHYVVGVYNGSAIRTYIDSVERATTNTGSFAIGKSPYPLYIGWGGTSEPSRQFNGSIDEVRIWNRSLSADEVYQQYVSNLQKFNSTQWYLYINQSKNTTAGLDYGTYTYQLFATDNSRNLNSTEIKTIVIGDTSSSNTSLNFLGNVNGATLLNFTGEGSTTPYSSTWGNCNEGDSGSWDYIQAICDRNGTYNTQNNKTHAFAPTSAAGSTWTRGGADDAGIMIINLNQTRTFNELIIFQMFSDGKVTSVQLFENYSNPGIWTSVIDKTSVGVGYGYAVSGGYIVTNATNITFADTTVSSIMLKFWNNGSYGNPSYIEVFSAKLFGDGNGVNAVDITYPIFSNYWDNNATLTNSGTGLFNVTLTNTNGTVLLEINNTNITATNLTANVYNASYNFTTNGTYSYQWHSWGNGTNHNQNISETRSYTVNYSDTDNDGLPDGSDPLLYNESNVTTSGISNLNITVGGNTTNGSYSGVQEVKFYDSSTLLFNFTHNFSSSNFDLSQVTITKTANSIIINLSEQLQSTYNKTIHITDNNFVSLCVKDDEIASIDEISSGCNGENETDFTNCLGNNTGVVNNSLTCIDNGLTISISNLRYSAILGTPATPSSPATGGGSSYKKKYQCYSDSDCKKNQYCLNYTCHNIQCFNDSSCDTEKGETCWNYKCTKLFDMEILEFESPVKLGDFFNFTYFIKAVAEINGDVEIDFWIEKEGKIATSGKDTIYMGSFEEKIKEKRLFLPSEIESGTYEFFIKVTYGDYTASAHRTIELGVNDGLATIALKEKENNWLKLVVLIIILLLISLGIIVYIFYKQRKEEEKILEYLGQLRLYEQKNKEESNSKPAQNRLEEIEENLSGEKTRLNDNEKNILTLLNSTEKTGAVNFVKEYIDISDEEINKIISELYKKGLIEIVPLNEGEQRIEMYFHTQKVTPDMLNDNIRFKKDMGWSYS